MTLSLVQTDTAQSSTLDPYCSTTGGTLEAGRQAEVAASVGSVEVSLTISQSSTIDNEFSYECIIANDADGAAGDWVVPINFSTGNMSAVLNEVFICQVRASSNIATIGSETSIGFATNGGLTTRTISGSAVTWVDGDVAIITLAFSETGGHSDATIGITPDQTITSPFSIDGADVLQAQVWM